MRVKNEMYSSSGSARLSQCSFLFHLSVVTFVLVILKRMCNVRCAWSASCPPLFSAYTISPGKEFGYANNRAKLFAAVRISGTPCTPRRSYIHKCIRMSADGRVYKCIHKFACDCTRTTEEESQPPGAN